MPSSRYYPRFLPLFSFLVFISLTSLLFSACGEQNKVYQVAIYAETFVIQDRIDGLKAGLKALGYVEEQNIHFVTVDTSTMQPEQRQAALKEAAAKNYDVYWTFNTNSARSLSQVVTNRPIIVPGLEEPVRAGLAKSVERPGGNVTGVDIIFNSRALKQLDWLVKISPELKKAYLIYDPSNPVQTEFLGTMREEATQRGISLVEKQVSKFDNGKIIPQLKGSEAQGVICLEPTVLYGDPQVLKNTVLQEKLQIVGVEKANLADSGILFTYGINNYAMGRQTAQYVDKVLHGSNPAELPIQNPDKLELALNQKLASQLGVQFPKAVLAAADAVIQ
jgi:putative ABC transport system substrate-binding protein